MRVVRMLVIIIGLFLPSVIPAQPFGETAVQVFDTGFLPVPAAAPLAPPSDPGLPAWVDWVPEEIPAPLGPPDIFVTEFEP